MAWCLFSPSNQISIVVLLAVAASFFYVGGCYLGDARDVRFDQANRPSRPIPAGILKESTVWIMGSLMMLIGLSLPAFYQMSHAVSSLASMIPLTLAILVYALWHKSSPWISLPFIGLCRATLIFMGSALYLSLAAPAESALDNLLTTKSLLQAFIVGSYTVCFASVARLESSDKKVSAPQLLKVIMLALPALSLVTLKIETPSCWIIAATYLLYACWTLNAFRYIQTNKGIYVSKCLAGFALVDCVLLASTGFTNIVIGLVLFLLALILQKIAPAT